MCARVRPVHTLNNTSEQVNDSGRGKKKEKTQVFLFAFFTSLHIIHIYTASDTAEFKMFLARKKTMFASTRILITKPVVSLVRRG